MRIWHVIPMFLMLAACEPIQGGPSGEKWVENVKLSNGEVLRVKREERHGQGEAGTSGGPLTYSSLEFDYRGQHYKWESGNVAPSILEIDSKGRPVVAGEIVYEWAWRERGSPCDKGVVQYFERGSWVQIPSWDLPVSNRLNLAADKARGEQGIAKADRDWDGPTHGNFLYYKNMCDGMRIKGSE